MARFLESGIRIARDTELVLGVTQTGQGKLIGAETLYQALARSERNPEGLIVQRVYPSDGDFISQLPWRLADRLYNKAGKEGRLNRLFYGGLRDRGSSGALTEIFSYIGNKDLSRALDKRKGVPFLTVHAGFKPDEGVFFAEIDSVVEPLAAHSSIYAFVPLPETARELYLMGARQNIEVVGFLVPEVIKNDTRKQERIATLSQEEPTKENPMRVAYMFTGHLAREDILRDQVLLDPKLQRWMKEGRMHLDVYIWDNREKAMKIAKFSQNQGMQTRLAGNYINDNEHTVQVVSTQSVQDAFNMAADCDVMITPIAERIGWTPEIPTIAVPPIPGNRKMIGNTLWAVTNGLAVEAENGQSIAELLGGFFGNNGPRVREHYEKAEKLKSKFTADGYGSLTGGAEKIAERMIDIVGR